MENKINIAELLKDLPSGMELDCTMYEDCKFLDVGVDPDNIIRITTPCGIRYLDKYGRYTHDDKAKCVIFPKGKTSWEGFVPPCQFKDGDVVRYSDCIAIFKEWGDATLFRTYVTAYLHGDSTIDVAIPLFGKSIRREAHLATEEEKAKLFQAIKVNGYKWNEETKTLEELVKPRFKVGDRIQRINKHFRYDITELTDTHYTLVEVEDKFKYIEPIIEDKNWELFEQKFKIGDKIRHKDSGIQCTLGKYSEGISAYRTNIGLAITSKELGQWELAPNKFDINTLKPFDKVLVRDNNEQKWTVDMFSFYDKNLIYPFVCVGHYTNQCIPYKGNEHLVGKTDDCNDYYKICEQ